MKIGWIFAGTALFAATGAIAQDAGGDDSKKDAEIQCRYERVTGSRTKARKMCMTRAEWRQHMSAQQEELRKIQEVKGGGGGGGG